VGKFIVDLNTIKVLKKKDLGKEEPLLWLFGIAIDLSDGSSSDPFISEHQHREIWWAFQKEIAPSRTVSLVEVEPVPDAGVVHRDGLGYDRTPTSRAGCITTQPRC
jgi:hypothetical protein